MKKTRLTDYTSKLRMHIVYRSGALRDQMLKLPFAQGIAMAHNRLQDIVSKSNNIHDKEETWLPVKQVNYLLDLYYLDCVRKAINWNSTVNQSEIGSR